MKIIGPIPDNILRRMEPKDRPTGPAGMTKEQIDVRNDRKYEKKLQQEACGLLRIRRIPVLAPRMDRRTTFKVGWPDATFGTPYRVRSQDVGKIVALATAWEFKTPKGIVRPEQAGVMTELITAGWLVAVIRSVEDGLVFLRKYSAE